MTRSWKNSIIWYKDCTVSSKPWNLLIRCNSTGKFGPTYLFLVISILHYLGCIFSEISNFLCHISLHLTQKVPISVPTHQPLYPSYKIHKNYTICFAFNLNGLFDNSHHVSQSLLWRTPWSLLIDSDSNDW